MFRFWKERGPTMKREQRENGTVIYLETEKDLRVYMHPLRQKILSVLERNPEGMSAKQIADALRIAPSSAGHHLQTLEQAGLVELDRIEIIHGFRAKLYRNTPVTVSVGNFPTKDRLQAALVQEKIAENTHRLLDAMEMTEGEEEPFLPRFSQGVLYSTPEEMLEFSNYILTFLDAHKHPGEGTESFEMTFFHYPTAAANKGEKQRGQNGDGKNG